MTQLKPIIHVTKTNQQANEIIELHNKIVEQFNNSKNVRERAKLRAYKIMLTNKLFSI